jgi:hypothetical protein
MKLVGEVRSNIIPLHADRIKLVGESARLLAAAQPERYATLQYCKNNAGKSSIEENTITGAPKGNANH